MRVLLVDPRSQALPDRISPIACMAEHIDRILEPKFGEGYDGCDAVSSTREAEVLIEDQSYDVIFLNYRLPIEQGGHAFETGGVAVLSKLGGLAYLTQEKGRPLLVRIYDPTEVRREANKTLKDPKDSELFDHVLYVTCPLEHSLDTHNHLRPPKQETTPNCRAQLEIILQSL